MVESVTPTGAAAMLEEKSKAAPDGSLRSHDSSQETDPTAKTEANILPTTADEAPKPDVEKAEAHVVPAPLALTDPRSFPDGGFEAWLVVFGGFCAMFCSFGWINCIGIFQAYYQSVLLSAYPPSTISWISSLETFMMFAGGPIVGKLYDNFGPRYILLIGSFLHVFGLMMASVSTEYYQIILAQGICSPIGASAVFYPSMNAVGTWFFRHRALAFGIIAAGSSLGGVILPIMIQHLIPKIGFPWTMRVIAFTVLGLLIIANLTVKSRIPPTRKPFAFMDFVRPLQELPFMLVVLACLFIFFGSFIPINFAILEARQFGMSVELSSYLLAILNAASLFGRTIPGHLGDVFGRFNVTIIFTFMTAIVVLALWIPARDNAPMIVFAALYGFGNGSFVSMAPALIAQISDIRQLGVRTGTLFAVVSIGALCGNPIGGALLSQDGGGYLYLQIFCGTFLLAGAITFLAARWALVKWKLQVKV